MSISDYDTKKLRLTREFATLQSSIAIGLNKNTSNLFRDRKKATQKLHVRDFDKVISTDKKANTITVEGMTTFESLTDAALAQGMVPLVVPELKTITIGGAVSGVAIESSSFKYGLVHESIVSMEVLTGTGKVLVATPDGPHKDLFYGMPNSYGTLGYILKLTIKARPAAPFVRLQHIKFTDSAKYFKALERVCDKQIYGGQTVQFVDGTIFSTTEMYITLGFDVSEAPYTSDYTYKQAYYTSIQSRDEDYLTMYDYIWRWDTDWFWCSKNVMADKGIVRRLLGKKRLGSKTYSKIMQFEARHGWYESLGRLLGHNEKREYVIQDIEVPISKATEFLEEFDENVGIRPIWVCPTRAVNGMWHYPLYPMNADMLYVNFGFWDSVAAHGDPDDGYYNRYVEDLVTKLGGAKSLYSVSYYPKKQFQQRYNYTQYTKLKKIYDPTSRFSDLYEKCVVRSSSRNR